MAFLRVEKSFDSEENDYWCLYSKFYFDSKCFLNSSDLKNFDLGVFLFFLLTKWSYLRKTANLTKNIYI